MASIDFIAVLPSLINAGIATTLEIQSLIKTLHPGMTEAELNGILALIVASAQKHKALADADQRPNA